MEFKQTKLDNGLMVIGEIMPSSRSLAMGFFTRTGARDESAQVSGVSHYLEHMMFKGTDKRTALEVNLEFDQMGAKYNAFTSEENTAFYAAVLPEYQKNVLDIWSDLLRPALRDEDFDIEKGVILEEIAMYKDLPQFDVLDRCRKMHFGEHCCGNSVLGTVDSITDLNSQQMRDYFAARYTPDNMVLTCAGNFDWETLIDQVQSLCGNWQAGNAKRQVIEFAGTGLTKFFQKEGVIREHICMMAAAPCARSSKRLSANVLANIIGDYTSSRLYWALIDTALADSADFDFDPMDGVGAYYTYVSCDPVNSEKVVDIVKGCFRDLRENGITEDELKASKNKIASNLTLSGELPLGRFVPLGYNYLYRDEYKELATELKELIALGASDINELLQEYPLEELTIYSMGPR